MDLPNVEPKNSEIASFDIALPQINIDQYDRYWKVFDPYNLEEPVSMSLIDDILDIYKDVKEGILLYERSEQIEAIWHWKFQFEIHWGRHAINAICALHSAIYSDFS